MNDTHPKFDDHFKAMRDEFAEKIWRGHPCRAEDYLEEAIEMGVEAVVELFALEFAILFARSQIDSLESMPDEPVFLDRLRNALGANHHSAHNELFQSRINQTLFPTADAKFQRGERLLLGGSPVILRNWLGKGGQGEVWSASLIGTNGKPEQSKIAVKISHRTNFPEGKAGSISSSNEQHWGRALCFLPGISLCWEAEVDGRRVVCTEDRSAKSLYDCLKGKQEFSQRDAVRIIERVATTLGCLHALSISHRDIKSANILLDPGDNPWLIDFGLATRTAEGQQDGRGTPLYQAPEEIRNNPRADIFSLGTVLSELLLGRPWDRKDRTDALTGALPTTGIPVRLLDILDGCLAPRVSFRFAHGMELAQALRCFLAEDRVNDGTLVPRRAGPVAVLAAFIPEGRVALACDSSKCRATILEGLRRLQLSEEPFSELTESLIRVVELGIARQIEEADDRSLSIDELASQNPDLKAFAGNNAWWAIEEWAWLLGKRWAEPPSEESSPDLWVYSSTVNLILSIESELQKTKEEDLPRRFRLRYQLMSGHNWLAWFDEETFCSWENSIKHRVFAEQIARKIGIACVILQARVHLAGALLRKPGSQDADVVHAAELLERVTLDDCEPEHLRQRKFLLAQIDFRRGRTVAAIKHLQDLLAEISLDDPDRERWVTKAYGLFLELKAFEDAQTCLTESLCRARSRNDRNSEWAFRTSEAALAQQSGKTGWQDRFDALLKETENIQDVHGAIAQVASEAYFNARQPDQAIILAQKTWKIQQDSGYFVGIVKTDLLLARLFDSIDDFPRAYRFAILGIRTMFANVNFSPMNRIEKGFRFWHEYPMEHELVKSIFKANSIPDGSGERLDVLLDRLMNSGPLTDEDRTWFSARLKK